jgi:serine/threonine protein kinase
VLGVGQDVTQPATHAVKAYKSADACRHEASVIATLRKHCEESRLPLFPRDVQVSADGKQILMAPVAHRFRVNHFTRRHGRQLVAAVQALHAAGFVHRDIRPSNILCQDDGSVLLIDFAFAQRDKEDDGKGYAGTVRYASDRVLSALSAEQRSLVCTQADDWASVVRTLFSFLCPTVSLDLDRFGDKQYAEIRSYWQTNLVGCWSQLSDAASILAHVDGLLPPDQWAE